MDEIFVQQASSGGSDHKDPVVETPAATKPQPVNLLSVGSIPPLQKATPPSLRPDQKGSDLRPEAGRGKKNKRGDNDRRGNGNKKKRGRGGKKRDDDERNRGGMRQGQAGGMNRRPPPGFNSPQLPPMVGEPAIQHPRPVSLLTSNPADAPTDDHGAEHKRYPMQILLLYRMHPDVQAPPTDGGDARNPPGPPEIWRHNMPARLKQRNYPFIRHQDGKKKGDEKQQKSGEKETREMDMEDVLEDDRSLAWVDAEVPDADFDFSAAVLPRDNPLNFLQKLAKQHTPATSPADPVPPEGDLQEEKFDVQKPPDSPLPPGLTKPIGPPQSPVGMSSTSPDQLFQLANQMGEQALPQMPKMAGQEQAFPPMPTGAVEGAALEHQQMKSMNPIKSMTPEAPPAERPAGEPDGLRFEGDGDLYEMDPEREQRNMERSMDQEQRNLEKLLYSAKSTEGGERAPTETRPERPDSPPRLDMGEMFGSKMCQMINEQASNPQAERDGLKNEKMKNAGTDNATVRKRLEAMRAKWGDDYLKQYVKMRYGQMMQNGYSQSEYARMQRKMMENMYSNSTQGSGSADGPNIEQLRAYYKRYQAFMRKLAASDPARLQKLQMYVMQKYGQMSPEKMKMYQQWYARQKMLFYRQVQEKYHRQRLQEQPPPPQHQQQQQAPTTQRQHSHGMKGGGGRPADPRADPRMAQHPQQQAPQDYHRNEADPFYSAEHSEAAHRAQMHARSQQQQHPQQHSHRERERGYARQEQYGGRGHEQQQHYYDPRQHANPDPRQHGGYSGGYEERQQPQQHSYGPGPSPGGHSEAGYYGGQGHPGHSGGEFHPRGQNSNHQERPDGYDPQREAARRAEYEAQQAYREHAMNYHPEHQQGPPQYGGAPPPHNYNRYNAN